MDTMSAYFFGSFALLALAWLLGRGLTEWRARRRMHPATMALRLLDEAGVPESSIDRPSFALPDYGRRALFEKLRRLSPEQQQIANVALGAREARRRTPLVRSDRPDLVAGMMGARPLTPEELAESLMQKFREPEAVPMTEVWIGVREPSREPSNRIDFGEALEPSSSSSDSGSSYGGGDSGGGGSGSDF